MPVDDSAIFRKAALDRLASPERIDERVGMPPYPLPLLATLAALLAGVGAFAAWLLLVR
jgi:hypothetical protein